MTYYLYCGGMCILVSEDFDAINESKSHLEADGFDCVVFQSEKTQELD